MPQLVPEFSCQTIKSQCSWIEEKTLGFITMKLWTPMGIICGYSEINPIEGLRER